jgi:hypothetical protein
MITNKQRKLATQVTYLLIGIALPHAGYLIGRIMPEGFPQDYIYAFTAFLSGLIVLWYFLRVIQISRETEPQNQETTPCD